MIDWFNFNGKDSRDVGILIKSKNSLDVPEKDVEYISVLGRSGDIVIDNNRWKNMNVEYECRIFAPDCPEGLNANLPMTYTRHDLSRMLCGDSTYYRLFDSYDPDYFRMAVYEGGINFSELKDKSVLDCNVHFNCKPFCYRWDGQISRSLEFSGDIATIYNPEYLSSKPYLKVYGAGDNSLVVNGTSMRLYGMTDYYEIDCETQNCFRGTVNKNSRFAGNFPTLKPGSNLIAITSSGITGVDIIPRWCAL